MWVNAFEGKDGWLGLTLDSSGAKLPADFAPWKQVEGFDLTEGDKSHNGVDPKAALDAIKVRGFFLTQITISV